MNGFFDCALIHFSGNEDHTGVLEKLHAQRQSEKAFGGACFFGVGLVGFLGFFEFVIQQDNVDLPGIGNSILGG